MGFLLPEYLGKAVLEVWPCWGIVHKFYRDKEKKQANDEMVDELLEKHDRLWRKLEKHGED